ncbi:hypothetical protein RJ639_027154, partial [Escallonia herrerae]
MAKLAISTDNNFFCNSHYPSHQPSIYKTHFRHSHLNIVPSRNRLKFKFSCSIKEKERENVAETEKVLTGLRVDDEEVQVDGTGNGFEKEMGFDWSWPPFKNLPQRYKLIGTTSLAFVICNMDKVNLSIAIIPMSHQFGWNSSVAGLVQSSFFWGYALSQLPGGWLAKVFGGRIVLQVGVLVWSFATALVPLLAGFMPGLVFSRILVGIGEGVSPSAATDLIARHVNTGGRTLTGCIVCLWWFGCWKRNGVPWNAFFQSKAVWAMIYAHFCGSWGHYTCLSWLPTYFSDELNLNLAEAAWVSVLPPLASVFVTSIAAQFADSLISNGVETTVVRKVCQTIAFLSPAACMILSSLDLGLPPWEIVAILTGGLALSSFALSGLYCTHQDISPEYASILLGITNTVGAVPGIVGVALTGYLLDSTHSWGMSLFAPSIFFYLTGT